MSNDKKPGGPRIAQDGYKPENRGHQPTTGHKVQGGYQGPGGARPAPPTTGSGVKPPPPKDKK